MSAGYSSHHGVRLQRCAFRLGGPKHSASGITRIGRRHEKHGRGAREAGRLAYREILENEDGIVLFTEAGSMDGGDKPLFDAATVHETSLVELYEKLQARAIEPETSVVDLPRLRTLDEHTIAARLEKNVTAPVASEEELIEKATYEGNLGGAATQADWDWWRGHCNPHTYVCEVGISGDRSFMKTNAYITSLHFNEHSTNQSTMLVMWDPCYDSSPFTFCTKPFKTLWNIAVAPRTWISAFSFNEDKYRWSVHAIGDLCGWSVTFDNPRTW